MIDHKIIYESHPLYQHFIQWGGLDDDDGYVMINTSLYAAEDYILNKLGVNLSAKVYSDKLPLGATETRFKHLPSNLLSIFKSNTLLLPTVDYFNTAKGAYETHKGDYYIEDNSATFSSIQSKVSMNYVSGYVAKAMNSYEDVTGGGVVDTVAPTSPVLRSTDDSQLPYPILTNTPTYVITVKGEEGSKVIVNEEDSGNVVGTNGEINITLNVTGDTNIYRVSLMDAASNVSDVSKVNIVKSNQTTKPTLTLLGHDIATKGIGIKCNVYLSVAGDIEVDGDVIGSYPKGVTSLVLPAPTATSGSVGYHRISLKVGTTKSKTSIIPYMFNTTFDELLLEGLNEGRLDIPYMPMDLMTAFFRLAHHLYHGTLYKDENIGRYSAGSAKAVTFTSHRIPKDILNILHSYVAY